MQAKAGSVKFQGFSDHNKRWLKPKAPALKPEKQAFNDDDSDDGMLQLFNPACTVLNFCPCQTSPRQCNPQTLFDVQASWMTSLMPGKKLLQGTALQRKVLMSHQK